MTQMGAWGDARTKFFFDLTPDRVLGAIEASGFRLNGRCQALGSYENRVYEVELEEGPPGIARRRVAKFYRPGRWTEAQILEEHAFLQELLAAEIPAVAPLALHDGRTLHTMPDGIHYAVFPKVGGRSPDEFTDEQAVRMGRLAARIHLVGAARPAQHRIELTPATYGWQNLEWMLTQACIPPDLRPRYEAAARAMIAAAEKRFAEFPGGRPKFLRVHGDCHPGNLLWNEAGPFFLDFDDFVRGPAAQDLWMLLPGRDAHALRQRELLLEGYRSMREFDGAELRLIEPLRGLRFIHYTAWIARRWNDPAFPAAFPEFGSAPYWADETMDLERQLRVLQEEDIA